MRYNTERNKLIISEYGRNVQNLIEHACTIEDNTKRNAIARSIIRLMGQLNPNFKNTDEAKHKLWDHLIIISDFKLKVDSPYPYPNKEELYAKPRHMGYPQTRINYRHYGKNVEQLVTKARAMHDPEKKKVFTKVIANYMKLISKNRGKESMSDEIIREDINRISKGELVLPGDVSLNPSGKPSSGRKKKRTQKGGSNTRNQQNSSRSQQKGHSQHRKKARR